MTVVGDVTVVAVDTVFVVVVPGAVVVVVGPLTVVVTVVPGAVTVLVVETVAVVDVVASPPHELERTKSSPSGPVPSCSEGSFVPESVTKALVSVAPPSASTTTPLKTPPIA